MGLRAQRLSTSEPDPESIEQAGAAARRYELTPLFWGFVSVVGLALLGTLVGLGAVLVSGQASAAAAFDKIAVALDVPGVCEQDTTSPWRGFIHNGFWVSVPGKGRLQPLEAVNKLQTQAYSDYDRARRRLSEIVLNGPSLCPAYSADECNMETLVPYQALVGSIKNAFGTDGDCKASGALNEIYGASFTAQLCGIIYPGDQNDVCFEEAKPDCKPFNNAVERLQANYPYPCHWSPTDSVGKMLSRYFSKNNALQLFSS